MAMGVREILLVMRARDQASRVIANVASQVNTLGARSTMLGSSMMGVGMGMTLVGAGMSAVGAAGISFFNDATKTATEYNRQAALTLTQTDNLKVSTRDLEEIGLSVARSIPVPLEQMQSSLYDIFSSMEVSTSQAKDLLKLFAKEAVAGQVDIQTAGRATISLMNAFKVPVEDANKVLDFQFQLVRKGVGSFDEFSKTIGRSIPSAVRAGQTYETLGGMLAFLTRNGLSTAMASASAARALDAMSNPTVTQRIQDMGIATKDAAGNFRPLTDVLRDLTFKFKDLTAPERAAAMKELFSGAGGTIQARRFFDLVFTNFDEFEGRVKDMGNSKGALEDAYKTMFNTPQSDMVEMNNKYKEMSIIIGRELLPIKIALVEAVGSLVGIFNNLPGPVKYAIVGFGALVTVLLLLSGIFLLVSGSIITMTALFAMMGFGPAQAGVEALGARFNFLAGAQARAAFTAEAVAVAEEQAAASAILLAEAEGTAFVALEDLQIASGSLTVGLEFLAESTATVAELQHMATEAMLTGAQTSQLQSRSLDQLIVSNESLSGILADQAFAVEANQTSLRHLTLTMEDLALVTGQEIGALEVLSGLEADSSFLTEQLVLAQNALAASNLDVALARQILSDSELFGLESSELLTAVMERLATANLAVTSTSLNAAAMLEAQSITMESVAVAAETDVAALTNMAEAEVAVGAASTAMFGPLTIAAVGIGALLYVMSDMPALNEFEEQIEGASDALRDLIQEEKNFTQVTTENWILSIVRKKDKLNEFNTILRSQNITLHDVAASLAGTSSEWGEFSTGLGLSSKAAMALNTILGNVEGSYMDGVRAAGRHALATGDLATLTNILTTRTTDLTGALATSKAAHDGQLPSLSESSEKLKGLEENVRNLMIATLNETGSVQAAIDVGAAHRRSLHDTLIAMGYNEDMAKGLSDSLLAIPKSLYTKVELDATSALATISLLLAQMGTINAGFGNITVEGYMAAHGWKRNPYTGEWMRRAVSGGPIPGSLGQPTPIMAHGGEYVLSADVVSRIKRGAPSSGATMDSPSKSYQNVNNTHVYVTTQADPYSIGREIAFALKTNPYPLPSGSDI